MVSGGATSLPQHTYNTCWHEIGSKGGQGDYWEVKGEEAGTHHVPSRSGHGQGDRSGEVPGVLGTDAEGFEDCFRRGHQSSVVSSTETQEKETLRTGVA